VRGLGGGEDCEQARGGHPTSVGGAHSRASRSQPREPLTTSGAQDRVRAESQHVRGRPTMTRTLLIDNDDSFTLNLFHLLAKVNAQPPVLVPNDWDRWSPAVLDDVDNVVLSPGPGTPARSADVGICAEVAAASRIPVLGICLGHQSIALAG